jgi:hypothetical protein
MRANIEKQLKIKVKKVFSSMFTSFDTSGRIAQLNGNGTFITRMVRGPRCIQKLTYHNKNHDLVLTCVFRQNEHFEMLNNEGLMYMFSPSTNNCKNG